MELIIEYIQQHIATAPFVIFLLLASAGANVPISEDVLNIAAAALAAATPGSMIPLGLSVVAGAYAGDQISYWFGRKLEPAVKRKAAGSSMYRNARSKKKKEAYDRRVKWMRRKFASHDILLLIAGRYVPFGFRNVLHLSAGFVRMSYRRYMIIDALSVLISTGVIFMAVYYFGSRAESLLKVIEYAAAILAAVSIIGFLFWQRAARNEKLEE